MPVKRGHTRAAETTTDMRRDKAVRTKHCDASNDAQLIACVRYWGLASWVFEGQQLSSFTYAPETLLVVVTHAVYGAGAAAEATLWQVQITGTGEGAFSFQIKAWVSHKSFCGRKQ